MKVLPYSIEVKNVTAEETRDMFKAFAMHFFVFFYILYIQFAVSEEAWNNIFLLTQKADTGGVLWEKVFLEISQNSQKTPVSEPLF